MIIKCVWCEDIIGVKKFKNEGGKIPLVTHSICKACQRELLSGESFEELLARKKSQPIQQSPLQP